MLQTTIVSTTQLAVRLLFSWTTASDETSPNRYIRRAVAQQSGDMRDRTFALTPADILPRTAPPLKTTIADISLSGPGYGYGLQLRGWALVVG